MKIPRHILAQAIAERTLRVTSPAILAKEIAAYLLAERRTAELESILRDIMQYRADHGRLEAEVVTAHDVTEEVIRTTEQLLRAAYPSAKKVRVNRRQDASVIGGARITMANEQLDMSVSAKLATFKRLTSEGIR